MQVSMPEPSIHCKETAKSGALSNRPLGGLKSVCGCMRGSLRALAGKLPSLETTIQARQYKMIC